MSAPHPITPVSPTQCPHPQTKPSIMGAILSLCCYTEPPSVRAARLARENTYHAALSGALLSRSHSFEPWQNPSTWPPTFDTSGRAPLPAVVGARGSVQEGMYTGEIHRAVPFQDVDQRGSASSVRFILGNPVVRN